MEYGDFVIKNFGHNADYFINKNVHQYGDKDLAYDELVAKSSETMLVDSNALEKLATLNQTDSSIIKKISEIVHSFIEKVKALYANFAPQTEEAQALKEMQGVVEEMAKLFEDMAVEGAKNKQSSVNKQAKMSNANDTAKKNTTDESGVRYSHRRFNKQIDELKNGTLSSNESIILGGTSDILVGIGLNRLPITMGQIHAKDAITYNFAHADRFIGEANLRTLPDALENPIAVITSATQKNNSVVVLVELTGSNNKPIITPIRLNGIATLSGYRLDANVVTTAHERKNAVSKLLTDALNDEAQGKVGIFYIDNKRAIKLASSEGLQLPNSITKLNGSIHSITDKSSPVNGNFIKISQTETKQFKRWFGESKVVDEKGNPLVVYHGTDRYFNTFLRTTDWGYHFGTEKAAEKRLDNLKATIRNVMPVYLSLKNPIYLTDTKDWLVTDVVKKLVQKKYLTESEVKDNYLDSSLWDLRKYLMEKGYDGVIYINRFEDKGSVSYTVFSSNQIKSATDNIGTFNGGDSDIRYSTRDNKLDAYELLGKTKELEKRNEALQEDFQRLKDLVAIQGKLTHGVVFTNSSLDAVAKQIKRLGNSSIDNKLLRNMLNELYQYIAKGEDLSWENVMQRATVIAEEVEKHTNPVYYTDVVYKDLLQDMRNRPFKLNDSQKTEIEYITGKKWSQAIFGKFKHSEDATPLDSIWKELSAEHPEIFDENISTAQQGIELIQAYDAVKGLSEVLEEYDTEEFISYRITCLLYFYIITQRKGISLVGCLFAFLIKF